MVAKQLVSNNTPSTTSSPVLFSLAGSEDDVATNITTSNSETATKNKSGESFVRSFRLRIVLLIGFILFSTTTMRMNLGMAIVCMVNGSAFSGEEIMVNYNDTGNSDLRCRQLSSPYGDEADEGLGYQGTLLWDTAMQSQLFTAVFLGTLVTIWAAGYLADSFGPKLLLTLGVLDYCVLSLASPLLANADYRLFLGARFFMGFGEGMIYPSISAASTRWFLPSERGRSAALYTTGVQVSSVVGNLVSSRLCAIPLLGGWPLIFYLFGLVGMLALVLWSVFFSDDPSANRWMSAEEKHHIKSVTTAQWLSNATPSIVFPIGATNGGKEESKVEQRIAVRKISKRLTEEPTPWRALFTSPAMYALLCAQSIFNFTAVIFQSYLPTYAKEVLQLNLQDNGLISVVPFAIQFASKISYGCLADWLKLRGYLGGTTAAKLFQAICSYGSALTFLALAFTVDCTRVAWTTVILIFYGAIFPAGVSGYFTSMLSIAPAHSGLVTSISTFFGNVGNALAPILVSAFHETGADSEWTKIFAISALANFIAGTVFVFFGSAEIQHWARPKGSQTMADKKRNEAAKI